MHASYVFLDFTAFLSYTAFATSSRCVALANWSCVTAMGSVVGMVGCGMPNKDLLPPCPAVSGGVSSVVPPPSCPWGWWGRGCAFVYVRVQTGGR